MKKTDFFITHNVRHILQKKVGIKVLKLVLFNVENVRVAAWESVLFMIRANSVIKSVTRNELSDAYETLDKQI